MVKFSKFSSENFNRLTVCMLKFRRIYRREIGEIVRYLPDIADRPKTKFRLPLKLSLLSASRPNSARANPQQCAHNNFTKFQHTYGETVKIFGTIFRKFYHKGSFFQKKRKNIVHKIARSCDFKPS